MNIFIISWRSFVALELVRLLHKDNQIFIWDSKIFSIAFFSKYIYKKCKYPSINKDINKFKEYLITYINYNKIDFLIPTCEEVIYIAYLKNEIEIQTKCKVFCGDFDLLIKLHSKYNYIKYLENFDYIRLPKTYLFNNKNEVLEFINKNTKFDYVLKPEFSRFAWNIASNKIKSKDLNKFIFEENKKYVIQEFISWDPICIYAVFNKWHLLISSFYKNLLTYSSWSWVYFESCFDDNLISFLKELWQKYNIHGQVSFDFICNDYGNFCIECNPRPTSWIHLFSWSNSFSKVFLDENNYTYKVLQPSNTSRSFKLILILFFINYIFSKNKLFFSWLFKSKDCIFSVKDIKPFFWQFIQSLYCIIESFLNKESLTSNMTSDIEYNWIIK